MAGGAALVARAYDQPAGTRNTNVRLGSQPRRRGLFAYAAYRQRPYGAGGRLNACGIDVMTR